MVPVVPDSFQIKKAPLKGGPAALVMVASPTGFEQGCNNLFTFEIDSLAFVV